jgi:hemerythrin-like domain-containing protein
MPRPDIFRRLRLDHRRVLAALDTVEREAAVLRPAGAPGRPPRAGARPRRTLPIPALTRLTARLQRQFATHLTAEDDSLYPALATALPETAASLEPLRAEHAELRAILSSLVDLLAAPGSAARDEQVVVQWRDFAELLRIHIRKEEAIVFHVAEQALPPRELARVEALRFPRRSARPRSHVPSRKAARP